MKAAVGTEKSAKAVATHDADGLSTPDLLRAYRTMVLSRKLDDKELQLKNQSLIFFQISGAGHEAVLTAAGMLMKPGYDWFYPYYRDRALCLALGMTPYEMLLSAVGGKDDPNSGGRQMPSHWGHRTLNIVSQSSPTGTQCLQSIGCAEAGRFYETLKDITGRESRFHADEVTYVSLGDGTTSEGEWHESMNFAAVHKLPLVMLVENNQWAISTPLHHQMGQPDIYKRAEGYGMPGEQFDGFDPIATYDVVHRAMERARTGGGPSIVEGVCYRFLAHSTDDNDMTYRTKDEVVEHRKDDPVPRFERVLLDAGVMAADEMEAMRKDVLRETNEATDKAEAMPYPEPSDLYKHVYEGAWEPWQ